MKKFLIVIVAVCLVCVGALGYLLGRNSSPAAEPEATEPVVTEPVDADSAAEDPTAEPLVQTVDYEAIYALHEPDEVIMTIGDAEFTWAEYFYLFFSQSKQVTDLFTTMATYYGTQMSWTEDMGDGSTYVDFCIQGSEHALRQKIAIETFAQQNKVVITAENREALKTQHESTIVSICGEGASEEDFAAYLETIYLPLYLYEEINEMNLLYQQNYIQNYGENGERYSDVEAMNYLTDNGYMAANHILLLTSDSSTGAALDEAGKAEKLADAKKLVKELRAITDPEKLVTRFVELKEEHCEDTGKAYFIDGYTFTPGTMVAEFENACDSLAYYDVSDPIETTYGYHIIIRLPLDVNKVMDYSESGLGLTALSIASNEEYGERLQAVYDSLEVVYADGYKEFDLLSYLK